MKKSQIYLGATTFVLAIAGVFAAKASQRLTVTHYFYTTAGGSCVVSRNQLLCTVPGSTACTTANGGPAFLTQDATLNCVTPLHRNNS